MKRSKLFRWLWLALASPMAICKDVKASGEEYAVLKLNAFMRWRTVLCNDHFYPLLAIYATKEEAEERVREELIDPDLVIDSGMPVDEFKKTFRGIDFLYHFLYGQDQTEQERIRASEKDA